MISKSVSAGLLASGFFLLFAGGCSDGIDLAVVDDNRETDGIETDLTDPAAVIESHDLAWSQRSYAAYEALLDEQFEFFPLAEDIEDSPWLPEDSYGKAVELAIANGMFHPQYPQGNGLVDLIEMDSTPAEFHVLDDGSIEATCPAIGRVMWTASDGAFFDTWFRFKLIERDGYLRIREIHELEDAGRSGDPGLVRSSWGRIKMEI